MATASLLLSLLSSLFFLHEACLFVRCSLNKGDDRSSSKGEDVDLHYSLYDAKAAETSTAKGFGVFTKLPA